MDFFKITLVDMQTFVETFQQKSFSKAAEKLYISRQSVARSIDNLENALAHKLFVRNASGIIPTDFGTEFYTGCTQILEQTQNLMQLPAEYDRKKGENISFGIMGRYRTGYHIEKMLQKFAQDHADLHIHTVHYDASQILQAVESGEVDFAFTNLDYAMRNPALKMIELEQEEFRLLVWEDHPFAEAGKVTAQMLASQKVLLVTRYNFPIYALQNYMDQQGIKDYSFYTTGDLSLVPDYICEDNAPALLLRHSATNILHGNPNIREVELSPTLVRHSGIIYRKNMTISSAAAHLLDMLVQKFSEHSEKATNL